MQRALEHGLRRASLRDGDRCMDPKQETVLVRVEGPERVRNEQSMQNKSHFACKQAYGGAEKVAVWRQPHCASSLRTDPVRCHAPVGADLKRHVQQCRATAAAVVRPLHQLTALQLGNGLGLHLRGRDEQVYQTFGISTELRGNLRKFQRP